MSLHRCTRILCVAVLLQAIGACATLSEKSGTEYTGEQLRDMGEKFLAAGALGQALKMLTEAEQKLPNDPAIQYDLGRGYEERGMDNFALEHYRKALTLKPDYAEAHNALGAFYAKRGDMQQAEMHLRKALENPFYETPQMVYFNLGLLYEQKGQPEKALEQFQQAVRLQTSYVSGYLKMGQILESLNRSEEAREAYGKAIERASDLVPALYRYGVLSYQAGEIENAIYSLNRVVKIAPYSSMASDSRKYLERMHGVMGGGTSKSSAMAPSERISHLDVINDGREVTAGTAGRKSTSLSTGSGGTGDSKLAGEGNAPPPGTQWAYIIQVGSFLERENAEALKERLKGKGYHAVVKPMQHQVQGQVFIVQLNPVMDETKAGNLMTQVETDEQVKAILIKVPAGR